ncbi:hypothetical protein PGTUg99_050177 [Puccinia graminis f. sp. tritici]|nr:hypothetical protein PGTUg99_050177 [Puccinia graminis f. sp. tritici]
MKKIDKHLNDAIKTGPEYIINMVTPMKEKYEKYWKKMDDFAAINIVFDPRCKLELINFLISDELSTEAAAASLNQIKSNIYSWFNDLARCQAPAPQTDKPDKRTKSTEDGNDDNDRFKAYLAGKKSNHSAPSPSAELDLYLQEPTVDIDSPSFDLLIWWKVNSLQFPTLARMAKIILMIPMTSIASESAFSTGGRVLSDSRSRLKPETLEALVCGQDWIFHDEGLYDLKDDEDDVEDVIVIT